MDAKLPKINIPDITYAIFRFPIQSTLRLAKAFLVIPVQNDKFLPFSTHPSIINLPNNTAVINEEITPIIKTTANPLIGPNPK